MNHYILSENGLHMSRESFDHMSTVDKIRCIQLVQVLSDLRRLLLRSGRFHVNVHWKGGRECTGLEKLEPQLLAMSSRGGYILYKSI